MNDLLVLSTVHRADDTRIREKLIPVLTSLGEVTYATKAPAPTDVAGLIWHPLRGGRIRRNAAAAWLALRQRWRVVVIHDPELVPLALVGSLLRPGTFVVDVHEDVPAQISTKPWLPQQVRPTVAWLAGRLLLLAERRCHITLAEENYAHLFADEHPTFANYPAGLPSLAASDGSVVYVGDVTESRGLQTVADALVAIDPDRRLELIGRYDATAGARLSASGANITLRGPLSHPEAMERMARAQLAVSPLHDIPNYRDSLPTKIIEYLGSGVPVVASDLPGTRRVIGGLPGVILAPPDDTTAWESAIRRGLDDSSLRHDAQRNAAVVRATFQWPAADVRAFYEAALATAGS